MQLVTHLLEDGSEPAPVVAAHRVIGELGRVRDTGKENGGVIEVPVAVAVVHEVGRPLGDERTELVGYAEDDTRTAVEGQRVNVTAADGLLSCGRENAGRWASLGRIREGRWSATMMSTLRPSAWTNR